MVLFATTVASAMTNSGTQVQLGVNAKSAIGLGNYLTGNLTYFSTPSKGGNPVVFAYAGPLWERGTLWIQPQVGYVGNWFDDDGGVVALWAGQNWLGMGWSLDCEHIFGGQESNYFGYYATDKKFGPFTVGAHVEQVDELYQAGPHIKFGGLKVQHFTGNGKNNIRIGMTIDIK
jgi:hypothetical protein